MGLRVNTNVASIMAQRNLRIARTDYDKSLEKLSSGSRINRAGDDAAGLAISEGLRANIRGLSQAGRNAEDGISLIQIAEGGVNEISNILIRLRELGVQGASDTIGDRERGFLNAEYQHLLQEIDRITSSTEFNGVKLLNGEGIIFDIQIGIKNDPLCDRLTFDASQTNLTAPALGLHMSSVVDKISAQSSLELIDHAIVQTVGVRANFGALQNRLQSTINNIQINTENIAAANARIRDADMAIETSNMARSNVLVQAGTSVLAQANAATKNALNLIEQTLRG